MFKSLVASFDTTYKRTLEANLEAEEAGAYEANLELIIHMNNNPSLLILFFFSQNIFFCQLTFITNLYKLILTEI